MHEPMQHTCTCIHCKYTVHVHAHTHMYRHIHLRTRACTHMKTTHSLSYCNIVKEYSLTTSQLWDRTADGPHPATTSYCKEEMDISKSLPCRLMSESTESSVCGHIYPMIHSVENVQVRINLLKPGYKGILLCLQHVILLKASLVGLAPSQSHSHTTSFAVPQFQPATCYLQMPFRVGNVSL